MNYRSSSSTTIGKATPDDLDAVRYVLVEAFLHGDLGPWLVPHVDTRHRIYWPYFAMLAEHALQYGLVEMTDDAQAVAVWYPIAGGHQPVIADYDTRLKAVTGTFVSRFTELDRAMHEHHPREQWHHYLAFLAVHPDHQRRGLGSALLSHHHAALDEAGTPAFVEATGTRNRHLYTRHGYLPRPAYRLSPGGPRLYPMWRPAAPHRALAES
jgi:ribosomal protein S18 acetylase RimI-like enzyme